MKRNISSAAAYQAATSFSNSSARPGSALTQQALSGSNQPPAKLGNQNRNDNLIKSQPNRQNALPQPPQSALSNARISTPFYAPSLPQSQYSPPKQQAVLSSNKPVNLTNNSQTRSNPINSLPQSMKMSRPNSKSDPDDAFYSGAWLFDIKQAPDWLRNEVPVARAPANKSQQYPNSHQLLPSQKNAANSQPTANIQLSPRAQTIRDFFDFSKNPNVPAVPRLHSKDPGRPMDVAPAHAPSRKLNSMLPSKPLHSNARQQAQIQMISSARQQSASYSRMPNLPQFSTEEYFFSGAWLFDDQCVPMWLREQLPKNSQAVRRSDSSNSINNVKRVYERARDATTTRSSPLKSSTSRSSYRNVPFKSECPEDVVESGAWLFELNCTPAWFQEQVKSAPTRAQSARPAAALQNRFAPAAAANMKQAFIANASTTRNSPPKPARPVECDSSDASDSGDWRFNSQMAQRLMQTTKQSTCDAANIKKNSGWQATQKVDLSRNTVSTGKACKQTSGRKMNDLTSTEVLASANWLFETNAAPEWLRSELKVSSKPSAQSQKPVMSNRSQSNNAAQHATIETWATQLQDKNTSHATFKTQNTVQRSDAQRQVCLPQSMSQRIQIVSNPMMNFPSQLKSAPQPAFSVYQSWEEISPMNSGVQSRTENGSAKAASKPRASGSRSRSRKSHH